MNLQYNPIAKGPMQEALLRKPALHEAVTRAELSQVLQLLTDGAAVNERDYIGTTAILG